MTDLTCAWDAAKAVSNLRTQCVSFQEGVTVFSDERGLLIDDPDHSGAEDRLLPLGPSAALRTPVVVHRYREAEDTIRIISARKATRPERGTCETRRRP